MSDADQQTRKIIVDESKLLGIQCLNTPNAVKVGVKVPPPWWPGPEPPLPGN